MSLLVYDLFSSAGGVGVALDRIADRYDVDLRHVGVDVDDYGDTYPGAFVRADASRPPLRPEPDIAWLSPPCQAYSALAAVNAARYDWDESPREHYDTFDDLRVREVIDWLNPRHYILENVPRCDDLHDPTPIDGLAFDLPFHMTRHFETSFDVPPAAGTGVAEIVLGNCQYVAPDLAAAKDVPESWTEQEIHSAIPTEYVQYLLAHCPLVDGVPDPSVDRNRTISEVTRA